MKLPLLYFLAAVLMSVIVLVIIFAAGGMPGYPETVYDSEFKVILSGGQVAGDEFWYSDAGDTTSGTDWSQGWECYGGVATAFVDAELAKKETAAATLEDKIGALCAE